MKPLFAVALLWWIVVNSVPVAGPFYAYNACRWEAVHRAIMTNEKGTCQWLSEDARPL